MSAPTRSGKRKSLADRRRAGRLWVLGALVLLVLVAFGGAVYALRLPAVTLSTVTVVDGGRIDTDAVAAHIHKALQGSYALVIPRSFALTYPREAIVASVLSTFPTIETVDVRREGLTALAVKVSERVSEARWCGTDTCYLMDRGGSIFDRADSVSGVAYSGLIEGEPVGQVYLAGDLPTLAEFVEAIGVATKRTPVSARVDAEGDVEVGFAGGGAVRFNRATDPAQLLENMRVTFASKQFSSGEAFEYADFRFGNRVYVKWQSE